MFLAKPPEDDATKAFYKGDLDSDGYVMNLTRLWAWRPDVAQAFIDLRNLLLATSTLSARERAVIVCATVSCLGDSYCALAWGKRLAEESDPQTAAAVLRAAEPAALGAREQALAAWARQVVRSPNATKAEDVERLRAAGFTEREIFEATALVAFRAAFCTVNDALGAQPDWQLARQAPEAVRSAVSYGREVSEPRAA
jgi:uncharacterized peroxidase-related enzyme